MYQKFIFVGILIVTLQALPSSKFSQKPSAIPQNNYPIRGAYIDKLTVWYGMEVAKGFALPGYAPPH